METVRRGSESRSRGEEMELLILINLLLEMDQVLNLLLEMDQVTVGFFLLPSEVASPAPPPPHHPLILIPSPFLAFRQHFPPNNQASDSVKFEKVCR